MSKYTLKNVHYAIENRMAFSCNGTLFGKVGSPGIGDYGRLNSNEYLLFQAFRNAIDYVVFSYDTPIAWHCEDKWHIVNQRFSVTTSRHQRIVRNSL